METLKPLNQISPAESYVLVHKSRADYGELVKCTLLDLCLRQVIEPKKLVKEIQSRSRSGRIRRRTINYFIKGSMFSKSKLKTYESSMLRPFLEKENPKISISKLTNHIQEVFPNERLLQQTVVNSSFIKDLKKFSLISKFKWNEEGNKLSSYIKYRLDEINEMLPNINDKQRATELFQELGGNIFLLINFKFELMELIDAHLVEPLLDTSDSFVYDSWWLYIDIHDFAMAMDSFDFDFDFDFSTDSADFDMDFGDFDF